MSGNNLKITSLTRTLNTATVGIVIVVGLAVAVLGWVLTPSVTGLILALAGLGLAGLGIGGAVAKRVYMALQVRFRQLWSEVEASKRNIETLQGDVHGVRAEVARVSRSQAKFAQTPVKKVSVQAEKRPEPVDEPARARMRAALQAALQRCDPLRSSALDGTQPRTYPVPELNGSEPVVTVVVPLYNEERFIGDTITSLKRQTVRNFRVIIVDDASTDRSAAIALKLVGGDTRFEVARHQRNSGLSASRNTGLRLATTPYVTFLDSDDMLLPNSLELRLQAFGEHTDDALVGVYCGMSSAPENIDARFTPRSTEFTGRYRDYINSDGEAPFNAHAPILRTAIVRQFGGFDEKLLRGCEDWDLWQRIMRHGYYFAPVNKIAAVYRRKEASMVRTMSSDHLRAAKHIFDRAHAADTGPQNGPFHFSEPLATYQATQTFA
ncbi:MAG: glycosyltransferase family A protein, partial [Pseudomonadota bacterium]